MISGFPIKAILFDVGGPIIDETPGNIFIHESTRALISEKLGREISAAEFDEALHRAIISWAPSLMRSVIWQFLKPDRDLTNFLHRKIADEVYSQHVNITLMDGIGEVVRTLAKNYMLALAANQPVRVYEVLKQTGLMEFFDSTVVSGDIGLSKPDSRFFLEICRNIDVCPESCVMIGDRLDNDIYPANVLGMRTIWIRSGPHAVQEPRVPEDVPDAMVKKMIDVIEIIERWKKDEGSS
ncbi:MAG: HAD family hydrolase [bacterium]|nr:HAD family hydrolase [bacterium]